MAIIGFLFIFHISPTSFLVISTFLVGFVWFGYYWFNISFSFWFNSRDT